MRVIQLKTIANGEIYLKDQLIHINDKSGRMGKLIFKTLPMLFIILGVYNLYGSIVSEKVLDFILKSLSSFVLLAISAHFYYPNVNRTNKKEVQISEIKNVYLKRVFGEFFIDFNLSNNSTRRVYNLKNLEDWKIIKEYLAQNNILYKD